MAELCAGSSFLPEKGLRIHSDADGASDKCSVNVFIKETIRARSFRPRDCLYTRNN